MHVASSADIQQVRKVATTIVSILQMKALRLREVKQLAQGHTGRKWADWNSRASGIRGSFPQWDHWLTVGHPGECCGPCM